MFKHSLVWLGLFPFAAAFSSDSLEEGLQRDYQAFLTSPSCHLSHMTVAPTVQFATHLSFQMQTAYQVGNIDLFDAYRLKVQAVLLSGVGVGGLSTRKATPDEEATMLQSLFMTGLYNEVSQKAVLFDTTAGKAALPLEQQNHIDLALQAINLATSVNPYTNTYLTFYTDNKGAHNNFTQTINGLKSAKTSWATLLAQTINNTIYLDLGQDLGQQDPHHDRACTYYSAFLETQGVSPSPLAQRFPQNGAVIKATVPFVGTPQDEMLTKTSDNFLYRLRFGIKGTPIDVANLNILAQGVSYSGFGHGQEQAGGIPKESLETYYTRLPSIVQTIVKGVIPGVDTIVAVQEFSFNTKEGCSKTKDDILEALQKVNTSPWNFVEQAVPGETFSNVTFYPEDKYTAQKLDIPHIANVNQQQDRFLATAFYSKVGEGSQPRFIVVNAHLKWVTPKNTTFPSALAQGISTFFQEVHPTVPKVITGTFNLDISQLGLSYAYEAMKNASLTFYNGKSHLATTTGWIFYPG